MALSYGTLQAQVQQLMGVVAGEVRGQATAVGTGTAFADVTVTDNLGTASKLGVAGSHDGGTFVADALVVRVLSTATNTTTIRVFTRGGGNIAVGATVLVDYRIWKA